MRNDTDTKSLNGAATPSDEEFEAMRKLADACLTLVASTAARGRSADDLAMNFYKAIVTAADLLEEAAAARKTRHLMLERRCHVEALGLLRGVANLGPPAAGSWPDVNQIPGVARVG